ncbi:MAG: lipoate--protein ligase family protein [candidate division Zixibacteria bacterium]|nr:lipoate--protein ligase family protein [candidate division Zixibacteria bacterium]
MKRWRVIFTGANDAFFNMALDEALLLSCQKGDSPPVLRLYLWKPPAVSMGYFQSAEKTVDLKRCKDRGIDVVRRITGGRAVLHEDEFTYSVCASADDFPQLGANTFQTYQKLSMALLESLHVLGVLGEWVKPSGDKKFSPFHMIFSKPCFMSNSRYEILVGGKKLIGSAQRRFYFRSDQHRKNSFIQHGSILTGKGEYSLAELLPGGSSVETLKQNLEEKSTNIEKILKRRVKPDEIISALKVGFEKVFTCRMEDSKVLKEELEVAQSLKEKKYLSERWNLRR